MTKTHFISMVLLLLLTPLLSREQQTDKANPYHLEIVSNTEEYLKLVRKNPANELVDLERAVPGIALDLRYATSNNFTHQIVYPTAKACARRPVADALCKIQTELKGIGLALKIFDAYRPYGVTLKFFSISPDTNFVASPKTGSRHNRGCAIDLTLIDLNTGRELEMPTTFDNFTAKAGHAYLKLPPQVLKNRQLLRETMVQFGFVPNEGEWWHYDFKGWRNYKIMDLSFEELRKN